VLPCPYCDYPAPESATTCPSCDGDLKPLGAAAEIPDQQFNRAVRAARAGDWRTAVVQLGAVIAARPTDSEAWLLLGTVHVRRGDAVLATDCWQTALALRPTDPRPARCLQKLAELLDAARKPTETPA